MAPRLPAPRLVLLASAAALVAALMLALPAPTGAATITSTFKAYSPTYSYQGKTLSEWVTVYLKGVLGVPDDVVHPLGPGSTSACLPHKSKGVWLLMNSGLFEMGGVRTCDGVVAAGDVALLGMMPIWLYYSFPEDYVQNPPRGFGYPANAESAATFIKALWPCSQAHTFLEIDGKSVNIQSSFRVPSPALFKANVTVNSLRALWSERQTPLLNTDTYGGGYFALLQFKKARIYTMRFGTKDACTYNLHKALPRPIQWIFTDAAGRPQPPETFTTLEFMIPILQAGDTGVFTKPAMTYEMKVRVMK